MKDKHDLPIQNIPIRTDYGKLIRKAFLGPVPRESLKTDYASLEQMIVKRMGIDSDAPIDEQLKAYWEKNVPK